MTRLLLTVLLALAAVSAVATTAGSHVAGGVERAGPMIDAVPSEGQIQLSRVSPDKGRAERSLPSTRPASRRARPAAPGPALTAAD